MSKNLTPEQLLVKYSNENKPKGQLTLFLGAAAGVGKTYAMLKRVTELLENRVDIVIGYIECHQRQETHDMVPRGVETIPLKEFDYKGIVRKELDLDQILIRKPKVVVIDELAHSNAIGARNEKRYQDVLEILDAGIDVYSAFNIQHLESLNNIVRQIVGVEIRETIPDFILEQAHEVKLIDISPDELITRLQNGKIYPKERIAMALRNFFRKGNLTALREIALLNTARKVEQQVKRYRNDNLIEDIWHSHDNLMVVLEVGYSTEKIIRSGKTMFNKGFSQWFVVYLDNRIAERSFKENERLIQLIELATELGAEVIPLAGERLDEEIVNFATEYNINTVLLSEARLNLYYRLFNSSLTDKIRKSLPEINISLINENLETQKNHDLELKKVRTKPNINYQRLLRRIGINTIIFTSLGFIFTPIAGFTSNINILMIYLLVLVLVNIEKSTITSVLTAFVATLSFDFFFIPPHFSFHISDLQYIFSFIIMSIIGVLFGVLNGNLNRQVSKLKNIYRQNKLLYGFSEGLASAMVESQVLDCVKEFIPQILNTKYALMIPDLNEELNTVVNDDNIKIDISIAKWVFDKLQTAGYGTGTFSGSEFIYLPINSKIRGRGVLVLEPNIDLLLPSNKELIDNLRQLLATTLERIHFTQIAIQTEIQIAKHNAIKK